MVVQQKKVKAVVEDVRPADLAPLFAWSLALEIAIE
jgi:hypothetical protein